MHLIAFCWILFQSVYVGMICSMYMIGNFVLLFANAEQIGCFSYID